MKNNKITWCFSQKSGIELTDLKPHLSQSYIQESDETLENVFTSKGKWKTIMAYYACYSAIYAILMKCGIKCEIHDCTLELLNLFPFTKEEKEFIFNLKEDRVKSQYHLKNIILKDEEEVKKFIFKCKTIITDLNSQKIQEIRNNLKLLSPNPIN